ncbi:hypothetical protein ZWY2020_051884 [Hordeum vulgare]|nr:hypothetical protein ZWY2020_051884 [Hordeum vulgare]
MLRRGQAGSGRRCRRGRRSWFLVAWRDLGEALASSDEGWRAQPAARRPSAPVKPPSRQASRPAPLLATREVPKPLPPYLSSDLLIEFHQPVREEKKKEIEGKDVEMGFDITHTKHKGQYALRKLYHGSPRLILVLYTSPTCGPSRTLKPILNKVDILSSASSSHQILIRLALPALLSF